MKEGDAVRLTDGRVAKIRTLRTGNDSCPGGCATVTLEYLQTRTARIPRGEHVLLKDLTPIDHPVTLRGEG